MLDYSVSTAAWPNFGTGNSTEILSGYTDYGTKIYAESGVLTSVAPENQARAQILISGEGTSVSSAAETSDGITEGDVWTTSNGMQIKVESVDYTVGACTVEGATCTANPSTVTTVKPVADNLVQVATSGMAPTQAIVIGGQKVNALARNVTVDGQALDSVLVSSGDKVAYIENGMIVAAGFTANDTKDAAALLIDAIERLI
jgi:hypothetical protein